MKLTKSKLKQIIKEEITRVLKETFIDQDWTYGSARRDSDKRKQRFTDAAVAKLKEGGQDIPKTKRELWEQYLAAIEYAGLSGKSNYEKVTGLEQDINLIVGSEMEDKMSWNDLLSGQYRAGDYDKPYPLGAPFEGPNGISLFDIIPTEINGAQDNAQMHLKRAGKYAPAAAGLERDAQGNFLTYQNPYKE